MTEEEKMDHQMDIIAKISELCIEIGWNIAIPGEEDLVQGLVIGTEEFIAEVVNGGELEYFEHPMSEDNGNLH